MTKVKNVSGAAIMGKEQLLCILENQYPPTNHTGNLRAIVNRYQESGVDWVALNSFVYGLIQGKREERARRRHNKQTRRRERARREPWTKEAFLKCIFERYKADGHEISEAKRSMFEWIGELVELAYTCGFEDGQEAVPQSS